MHPENLSYHYLQLMFLIFSSVDEEIAIMQQKMGINEMPRFFL